MHGFRRHPGADRHPHGRILALALLFALQAACAKPPPDLDGVASGAQGLALGTTHADALDCRRGDCADWFRTRIEERGTLHVRVGALEPEAGVPRFMVQLADGQGQGVAQGLSEGGPGAELVRRVEGGTWLVAVSTQDERPPLRYELHARFEPEPPPPPPAPPAPNFETVSGSVLEVEGIGAEIEAVLVEFGSDRGLRPGLAGRLVDAGETIGRVVIQEVYPEGSRARVEGSLSAPITPQTRVEVEVPVD